MVIHKAILRFFCYDIPTAMFLGWFAACAFVLGALIVKGIKGFIEG